MGELYPLGKSFYEFGEMLLWDDIHDLGYYDYYGRKDHYYHGKPAPDHPSPFHHWQWAGWFMLVGQMLAYADIAKELQGGESEQPEQAQKIRVFDI